MNAIPSKVAPVDHPAQKLPLRVLIVDDEELVGRALQRYLRTLSFDVVTVTAAVEGLAAAMEPSTARSPVRTSSAAIWRRERMTKFVPAARKTRCSAKWQASAAANARR